VVQESLTNALKHADPRHVVVRVAGDAAELRIEVVNDGAFPPASIPSDGGGLGLAGLRERIRLLGGQITAGRQPAGGFRVHARLPLDDRDRAAGEERT